MLKLYSWGTVNGYKPLILLEELGEAYQLVRVNIREGEQKRPDYLRINPNGRIPALVDETANVSVFESGAILWYVATKYSRFLAADGQARASAMSWLFFQMSGIGPICGQASHFRSLEEKLPYAIERFTSEANRLWQVLDERLKEATYLAGDEYSIADIATWPWMRAPDRFGLSWKDFPHVRRWFDQLHERPALRKALAIPF